MSKISGPVNTVMSGTTLTTVAATPSGSGAGTQPLATYECSIHGIIHSDQVNIIRRRIESICYSSTMVGTQKREEPREQCQKFKIYEPKVQTPIGPKRKNDILLFTKKEYDENNKVKMTIFEYGQPDTKASRSATIRPITSSGIYNCEPEKLLENLGYREYASFTRKGYWYDYYGRQKGKIGLYKVERGTQGKQKEQGQEQAGNNDVKESEQSQEWIVEVTSFAKGIDNVQYSVEVLEQIKKELNMLLLIHRDKIKLDLVVVDHIYTQSKISYR